MGWSSSSGVPTTATVGKGTRLGIRRGGGGRTSGGNNGPHGRFDSGSRPRSEIGHGAEDDGPGSRRIKRAAVTKAKGDGRFRFGRAY